MVTQHALPRGITDPSGHVRGRAFEMGRAASLSRAAAAAPLGTRGQRRASRPGSESPRTSGGHARQLVAGAGIAGHIHMHVLPRWKGDANFMSTVGNTRIIPEALEDTYAKLKGKFATAESEDGRSEPV